MNLKSFFFCLFFFVVEYSGDILQEHAYIRSLSSREGWIINGGRTYIRTQRKERKKKTAGSSYSSIDCYLIR